MVGQPYYSAHLVRLNCARQSSIYLINRHTWYWGSKQSGELRLAKFDGMLAKPVRCWTEFRYQLAFDKNVATLWLHENSRRFSFLNACTQGLLSVNMCVWCFDCMIYGLNFFIVVSMPKASISHGSHFIWCFLSFALKKPVKLSFDLRETYSVALSPRLLICPSVTIHNSSPGIGSRTASLLSNRLWAFEKCKQGSPVHWILYLDCFPAMAFSRRG